MGLNRGAPPDQKSKQSLIVDATRLSKQQPCQWHRQLARMIFHQLSMMMDVTVRFCRHAERVGALCFSRVFLVLTRLAKCYPNRAHGPKIRVEN
jgi:hypothetical protein